MNLVVTIGCPQGQLVDIEVQKITDSELVRRIMATIIVYEDEQASGLDVEALTERMLLDFVRENHQRINTLLRAEDKFSGDPAP